MQLKSLNLDSSPILAHHGSEIARCTTLEMGVSNAITKIYNV